jgi:hypothetical protein
MLSAGPLGEAWRSPDMTEKGAVTGDTISTTSRKAASRPMVLHRIVMGVRNPMAVVTTDIQNRRHATAGSWRENGREFTSVLRPAFHIDLHIRLFEGTNGHIGLNRRSGIQANRMCFDGSVEGVRMQHTKIVPSAVHATLL